MAPSHSSGAVALFEGRVRDTNDGRTVRALEYEAYEELAVREGVRILEEARRRFQLHAVACVHRIGLLTLGEVAIRVEVSASHRRAAFAACEWIVDEVKRTVPIWKKEHYADGESGWLNSEEKGDEEARYYARQIRLPNVGAEGQARLKSASALVVGAGGLGCPALLYLAAAGVGKLGLCEPDRIEVSNLHRQILYSVDEVGRAKSDVAAAKLRRLNPFIEIIEHSTALSQANANDICGGYDLILDCSDNFETKYLLNDCAVALSKPLISASVYRQEGQLFVFQPGRPCLRCLRPIQPPSDCVGSCAEVGILGFVPGVFGCLQASETVSHFLGMPLRASSMTIFDLETLETTNLNITRDPNCPACGNGREETPAWELRVHSKHDLRGYTLVDIREEEELIHEPLPFEVDAWAPMSATKPEQIMQIAQGPILLVCRSGARTAKMAAYLHSRGETRVFSLAGGRRTVQAVFAEPPKRD